MSGVTNPNPQDGQCTPRPVGCPKYFLKLLMVMKDASHSGGYYYENEPGRAVSEELMNLITLSPKWDSDLIEFLTELMAKTTYSGW